MRKIFELKDKNFDDNQLSLTAKLSVEDELVEVEFTLKSSAISIPVTTYFMDIDLPVFNNLLEIGDHYFTEPNIWITTIDVSGEDVTFYINIDYGELTSYVATESGFSLRMNVSRNEFVMFFSNISSLIT
ncbi:hypothetical protein BFS35_000755 [Macrococcoides goetzii]|uniref:Uncharacterized protein n=1 Tax=Macrococcoides goetzii TaxID=1891097 RepID=A0A2G5NQI3_9STAP|nr:hypothetical protein [Macrococcus goetzii]RAI82244.1 hypothetical protein BFS35_000755 [Macrococcus goetzii]